MKRVNLDIYPDMMHSYIVELKYAKYKDPENRVEELRREAAVSLYTSPSPRDRG